MVCTNWCYIKYLKVCQDLTKCLLKNKYLHSAFIPICQSSPQRPVLQICIITSNRFVPKDFVSSLTVLRVLSDSWVVLIQKTQKHKMLSKYEKGCFLQPTVGGSVISCTFVTAGVKVTSQICKINLFDHSSIFNALESILHICIVGRYRVNGYMPSFVTRLSYISLFSTKPKSGNFCTKNLIVVHPS